MANLQFVGLAGRYSNRFKYIIRADVTVGEDGESDVVVTSASYLTTPYKLVDCTSKVTGVDIQVLSDDNDQYYVKAARAFVNNNDVTSIAKFELSIDDSALTGEDSSSSSSSGSSSSSTTEIEGEITQINLLEDSVLNDASISGTDRGVMNIVQVGDLLSDD